MENMTLYPIGRICVQDGEACIVLEERYAPALSGLEGFDCIQVLWWFDRCDNACDRASLTEKKPYKRGLEVPDWRRSWPKSCEESGDFDWESEFNF